MLQVEELRWCMKVEQAARADAERLMTRKVIWGCVVARTTLHLNSSKALIEF